MAALFLFDPADHWRLYMAAACLAVVGTIGIMLCFLYVNPQRAYRLGYDVGWSDGRRAERLAHVDGAVVELPRQRVDLRSPLQPAP